MFFAYNKEYLEGLVRMSHAAGNRSDYIQGGGGNTSAKLPDGLMAIKASGFCLKDMEVDKAYAVLNGAAIREFYKNTDPEGIRDVEKTGSAITKENTLKVEGLAELRPSVEAGFHSILKNYVLHTHSVYANLAACSKSCKEIAQIAFAGAPYSWGWVDYTDPGSQLTFAIRDELSRVVWDTGKMPSVIMMQNHGIIVHDDDVNTAIAIHTDANNRIAALFGMSGNAFPEIRIKELAGGMYLADVPYLKECLKEGTYTWQFLMEEPLYPDQMVFLTDTFFMDEEKVEEGKCVASTKTGELILNMDEKKAMTMVETLTAVFFIMNNITAAGYELSTMGEAAKDFISNWESEKYRKSLAGKK